MTRKSSTSLDDLEGSLRTLPSCYANRAVL